MKRNLRSPAHSYPRLELERFSQLFSLSPDVIYSLSPEGIITSLSPSFEKATGWKSSFVIGKHFAEFVHPDDMPLAEDTFRQVLEGMIPPPYELRIKSKRGYIVAEFTSAPEIRDGVIVGEVGIARDITQHKKREEENKQLAAIVRSVDTAVISRTLDGTIVSWNKAAEQLYGYRAEEALGQPISFVAPLSRHKEIEEVNRQIKKGKHVSIETQRLHKDGRLLDTLIRISPVRDVYGTIIGTSSFARDITEQKRQERGRQVLMKASKMLFSSLHYDKTLKQVAQLTIPQLADQCIMYVIDSSEELTRLVLVAESKKKRESVPEDSLKDIVKSVISRGRSVYYPVIAKKTAGETSDPLRMSLSRAVGKGSAIIVPIASHRKMLGAIIFFSGVRRYYLKSDFILAEELGRRAGQAIEIARLYHASQKELTERRMVEGELRRSRNQLEVILQNTADGITVQDQTGKLTYANEAAARAAGYRTVSDMLTHPRAWLEYFTITDETGGVFELANLPGRRALAGDPSPEAIIRFKHTKTGEERWSLIKSRPVLDENGSVQFVVNVFHDISHIKRSEQRKDEFFSIASHELKTPLTSIKAFAQLIMRKMKKSGEGPTTHYLQRMDEQINKLTALVQDLLDVTKIQSGKLIYRPERFDFDEIVRQAVEDIKPLTDRHTIRIECKSRAEVYADKYRIEQVLMNLLSNAIKYSPRADSIIVKTWVQGGVVMASVQDFGIGIPSSNLADIFQRFYRVVDEKRESYPGLGLGLFISREIIHRQGGTMWVESEEDRGSTFYFQLPLNTTYELAA